MIWAIRSIFLIGVSNTKVEASTLTSAWSCGQSFSGSLVMWHENFVAPSPKWRYWYPIYIILLGISWKFLRVARYLSWIPPGHVRLNRRQLPVSDLKPYCSVCKMKKGFRPAIPIPNFFDHQNGAWLNWGPRSRPIPGNRMESLTFSIFKVLFSEYIYI